MLVIEIDSVNNGNLLFQPLGQLIRGRFDAMRVKLEENGKLYTQLPPRGIIPGQRLALDEARGVGFILEPLRDRENAQIMRKVLSIVQDTPHPRVYDADRDADEGDEGEDSPSLSDGLPRARQAFPLHPNEQDTHPAETWAYWMQRAVKANLASVVSGSFADAYPNARRHFGRPREVDPRDVAVTKLASQLELLTKIVFAGLTPAQRKAFDELAKAS